MHCFSSRTGWLGVWLLAAAPAVFSKSGPLVCGTHPDRGQEEIQMHRAAVREREIAKLAGRLAGPPSGASRDIGQIAVLEDRDGVISRRNPFNLGAKTVTFGPSRANAAAYRFQTSDGGYDETAASAGAPLSGLDDDDSRRVPLPFAFPFFGVTYNAVFVNSDGNLTFGSGDTSTSDRSLGRLVAGQPRIAPLFSDLDPSVAPDSVRVLSESGRFVVSWVAVPEYQRFGTGPRQTFQARLYPDGRIELAFAAINTTGAVTGIAPGNLQPPTSVVSFAGASPAEYTATIAERFGGTLEVDMVAVAQRFYETHEDAYDYLVVYNALAIPASSGAVAYEVTVRSDRQGNGTGPADTGRSYGSPRRLQAVLNLGPLSQYPLDPNALVPARSSSRDTPVTVLAHETGHLFLAFASVRDPQNPRARPMLGFQSAHWNFGFNSEASLLEGNRIQDNGPGADPRFETTAVTQGYSPLDQYLMGFRPAQEVPPTFLVTGPAVPQRIPQFGARFNGDRRDVTIEELIAAEGRRIPEAAVSQRRFRFAFILIVEADKEPAAAEVARVDAYRREFENFYRDATGGRATADTALRRAVQLSLAPAAGVIAGRTANATVSIATAAASPLTFTVRTSGAAFFAPSTVTIPPGASSVNLPVTGLQSGIEDLTVEASDPAFESASARVATLASIGGVRLAVVSGDRQLAVAGQALPEAVVVKATDANNLPYAGIAIRAVAAPGASVTPDSAVTGTDGTVRFTWIPGQGSQLRFSLDGVVGGATATASAPGLPAILSGAILNAASGTPALAPGSIASIFGSYLGAGLTNAASAPFPTTLGETRVFAGGIAAPLLFVSDGQINFLVPPSLSEGPADVRVLTSLGITSASRITLQTAAPAIFADPVTGIGAIVVAGSTETTRSRPARPGEILEIYCTGLGATQISTRGLQETLLPAAVRIGGASAEVLYSGLTAVPGLYQVNAVVPAAVPAGSQSVAVSINGVDSLPVRINITR